VDLGEHEVQIFRALKAALLGQIDVAVKFSQDLEQGVVRRQVQIKILPHFLVRGIGHVDLLVAFSMGNTQGSLAAYKKDDESNNRIASHDMHRDAL
jgi:hypothetical protein